MVMQFAFVIDETTDRELASDGISRYGAYLRQKTHMFRWDGRGSPPTQGRVEFAIAAWTIARTPIMAPGYVTDHPRIQDTTGHWDDDGRAALAIQIAVPAPQIAHRLPSPWREWTRLPHSQTWVSPHDNDHLTVLTTLTIRLPLPAENLPNPRYRSGVPNTDVAKRSVMALCETLNTELAGLLTALDNPTDTTRAEANRW